MVVAAAMIGGCRMSSGSLPPDSTSVGQNSVHWATGATAAPSIGSAPMATRSTSAQSLPAIATAASVMTPDPTFAPLTFGGAPGRELAAVVVAPSGSLALAWARTGKMLLVTIRNVCDTGVDGVRATGTRQLIVHVADFDPGTGCPAGQVTTSTVRVPNTIDPGRATEVTVEGGPFKRTTLLLPARCNRPLTEIRRRPVFLGISSRR
jgi:hypothetical protein